MENLIVLIVGVAVIGGVLRGLVQVAGALIRAILGILGFLAAIIGVGALLLGAA